MGSSFNSISIIIISIWLTLHTLTDEFTIQRLEERIKSLEEQIKEKENNNE